MSTISASNANNAQHIPIGMYPCKKASQSYELRAWEHCKNTMVNDHKT